MLISVIPEDGPNAQSTNHLVYDLRDYNKTAKEKYDFNTEISGQSVINIDMSEKLNEAIPVFAGVIVLLAFCTTCLCIPFNLSTIESCTRVRLIPISDTRIYNTRHARWLLRRLVRR